MHNVRSYAIPACKGSHLVSFVRHAVHGHEHINLPTSAVGHSVASAQLTNCIRCLMHCYAAKYRDPMLSLAEPELHSAQNFNLMLPRNNVLSQPGITQKYLVVTTSYEARRRGITKLMGIAEARQKCPDLVLVSGEDLGPYRAASRAILDVLRRFGVSTEPQGSNIKGCCRGLSGSASLGMHQACACLSTSRLPSSGS